MLFSCYLEDLWWGWSWEVWTDVYSMETLMVTALLRRPSIHPSTHSFIHPSMHRPSTDSLSRHQAPTEGRAGAHFGLCHSQQSWLSLGLTLTQGAARRPQHHSGGEHWKPGRRKGCPRRSPSLFFCWSCSLTPGGSVCRKGSWPPAGGSLPGPVGAVRVCTLTFSFIHSFHTRLLSAQHWDFICLKC